MTNLGVATPDMVAGMTGLEMIEAVAAGRLPAPPISGPMRMTIAEVEKGIAAVDAGEVLSDEQAKHEMNLFMAELHKKYGSKAA